MTKEEFVELHGQQALNIVHIISDSDKNPRFQSAHAAIIELLGIIGIEQCQLNDPIDPVPEIGLKAAGRMINEWKSFKQKSDQAAADDSSFATDWI